MGNLIRDFHLEQSALAHLTSAVQLGFISGTLFFAILNIADRYSPSKVFFISACVASLLNLALIWSGNGWFSLVFFRFLTGFFLAGIYPVGMKIAADHFAEGLGKSLSFLVGALVLGTAFPHLLKAFANDLPWRYVIIFVSLLAAMGGLVMYGWVPDGPYRKKARKIDLTAFFAVFRKAGFRSAAFGYFGHMWELYTFWAFVPFILNLYINKHPSLNLDVSVWSFLIIGVGGFACFAGGFLAHKYGTKRIAAWALSLSGICCIFSPITFQIQIHMLFLIFLLLWAMFVIADSPLFSTLVANSAIPELKGTALTIVNCIGFSITILSIQFVNLMLNFLDPIFVFAFLSLGPILGVFGLIKKSGRELIDH